MQKETLMANREQIIVRRQFTGEWKWIMTTGIVHAYSQRDFATQRAAITAARAFSLKFRVPPEVIVHGESDVS